MIKCSSFVVVGCNSWLNTSVEIISGAKMSTSEGLINRDLEQMSKINGEITILLQ